MSLDDVARKRVPVPDDMALFGPDDEDVNPLIVQARNDLTLLASKKFARGLGGMSLDDILAEADEPVPWFFHGLFTYGATGIICAEAKGTKTWIACELMVSASSGTPVFGKFHVTEKSWSLGCFLEDGKRGVRSRMRSLKLGRSRDFASVDTSRVRIEVRPKIDLENPMDVAWIIASARSMPEMPKLIVIDPLRNAHTADENASTDMQPVMDALSRIRDITGATVLTPHHMGRPSKDKAGQRLANRVRGSTAIFGSVDGAILIENKKFVRTDKGATWKSLIEVECREATPAPAFGLELDVQTENGDARVAGWCVHDDPAALTETEDQKADAQEEILKLLRAELAKDREAARQPRCFGGPELTERTGIPTRTIRRYLDDLAKGGDLTRSGRQWRAVDALDDERGGPNEP